MNTLSNATGEFELLAVGDYVAIVIDANNCENSLPINIASSEAIELTGIVQEGLCGELGSIQLMADGIFWELYIKISCYNLIQFFL